MKKGKVLLTKRILAFLVAFLMVVSSMSLPVFAAETDVTDEAVVTTEDKQVTVEQKEDAQETVSPRSMNLRRSLKRRKSKKRRRIQFSARKRMQMILRRLKAGKAQRLL